MLTETTLPMVAPGAPLRADALPAGWLALRGCRLGGATLPLILLHPAHGVAIIGGPPDGPTRLRDRLAASSFAAIFPGVLPMVWLPGATTDPAEALASQPPIAVPGGEAWVRAVRRILEAPLKNPVPVPQLRWARRRRLRRQAAIFAGLGGLVALGAAGWIVTLPPTPLAWVVADAPQAGRGLPRAAPPVAPTVPDATVPDTASAGPATGPTMTAAAPAEAMALPPAARPPDQPASDLLGAPPGPEQTVLPLAGDGPAVAATDPAEATAFDPTPPAAAAADAPPPAVAMVPEAAPMAEGPVLPERPVLQERPVLMERPGQADRPALPDHSALAGLAHGGPMPVLPPRDAAGRAGRAARRDMSGDPATASSGTSGRCRLIVQRLQIGESVPDVDLRFLQRGCQG